MPFAHYKHGAPISVPTFINIVLRSSVRAKLLSKPVIRE